MSIINLYLIKEKVRKIIDSIPLLLKKILDSNDLNEITNVLSDINYDIVNLQEGVNSFIRGIEKLKQF